MIDYADDLLDNLPTEVEPIEDEYFINLLMRLFRYKTLVKIKGKVVSPRYMQVDYTTGSIYFRHLKLIPSKPKQLPTGVKDKLGIEVYGDYEITKIYLMKHGNLCTDKIEVYDHYKRRVEVWDLTTVELFMQVSSEELIGVYLGRDLSVGKSSPVYKGTTEYDIENIFTAVDERTPKLDDTKIKVLMSGYRDNLMELANYVPTEHELETYFKIKHKMKEDCFKVPRIEKHYLFQYEPITTQSKKEANHILNYAIIDAILNDNLKLADTGMTFSEAIDKGYNFYKINNPTVNENVSIYLEKNDIIWRELFNKK